MTDLKVMLRLYGFLYMSTYIVRIFLLVVFFLPVFCIKKNWGTDSLFVLYLGWCCLSTIIYFFCLEAFTIQETILCISLTVICSILFFYFVSISYKQQQSFVHHNFRGLSYIFCLLWIFGFLFWGIICSEITNKSVISVRYVLVLVALGPVMEELLVHELFFYAIKNQPTTIYMTKAVTASLLITLGHHYPWIGSVLIFALFFMPFLYRYYAKNDGSVVPCIVFHSIYNAVSILIDFV